MKKLSFLQNFFNSQSSLSEEERTKLFEDLLFLVLSRASRSDLDISAVEIEKIQQILKDAAGIDASQQDIRTAGMSELYEVAPIEKFAAKSAKALSVKQRHTILKALYDVIGIDGVYSHSEADFYDNIASAMRLRPVEMMGAEIDGSD
ncbi:MAG: TerB family tellurite resistance protein [Acidiferrobacterales bacterium]|nr:TerB family tellurite resistance protein [Acidiferrobacterales bacterium]